MDITNELFRRIGATSKRSEKEAIIKEYEDSELFKAILKSAYDPLISYGIQQVPEPDGVGNWSLAEAWVHAFDLLNSLAKRQLTGNTALSAIESMLNNLNEDDQELFTNILKKDLRCGIGEGTVNKLFKGLLPEFPYMRCCLPKHTKLSEFPWDRGVFSQIKADGMFANLTQYDAGDVVITSRQGQPFDNAKFSTIVNGAARELEPYSQTHGEFVVYRDGKPLPREESNGIMNHVQSGGNFGANDEVRFFVWDQIQLEYIEPKGRCDIPYSERLDNLEQQVKDSQVFKLIETRIVHSIQEAYTHNFDVVRDGMEGTILKHPDAFWIDGTSKQQVKLKMEVVVELRVKGFKPGNGKNAATFGSILFGSECDTLEVGVSGMSDKLRNEIHENREDWLDSVCSVKFNVIMHSDDLTKKKHSLFLPRFSERRSDKTTADTYQQICDQFEAAKELACQS